MKKSGIKFPFVKNLQVKTCECIMIKGMYTLPELL